MPYDSRAYRILIASPSDVEEERELAVRIIQEWNDLYSYSRKVVLLPLRWETHTAPDYGTRPQEVINRAIVDQCDLLLGIFWTRIGSPTGEAESGTIEEITRVARAGKPIMLYFSKAGIDPDKLNISQVSRLKAFKDEIASHALTESYRSQIEFRDKLSKQLELKVRDLQSADSSGQPPPLLLAFVSEDRLVQKELACRVDIPLIKDLDTALAALPDEQARGRLKEAVNNYVRRASSVPVTMAVSNTGTSGVRNVYVEMSIHSSSASVSVTDYVETPWRYTKVKVWEGATIDPGSLVSWDAGHYSLRYAEGGLSQSDEGWEFSFEWDALQPQRTRLVRPRLFVTVTEDAKVEFSAKVFADGFPQPLNLRGTLVVSVGAVGVDAKECVGDLDFSKPGAGGHIRLL